MGRTHNIDSTGCHNASIDCTVEGFCPSWQVFANTFRQAEKLIYYCRSMNRTLNIFAWEWVCMMELLASILLLKGGRFATQCAIFGPFHFLFYQICQLFRLTCSPIDWASKIPRRPGSSNWNKIQNIQTIQSKIHSEPTTMVFRNNGKWSLSSADRQSNNREGGS